MILELVIAPDDRLRTVCLPISEVTEEIRSLWMDMIETMKHYKGIGLAANQVGVNKRMIVIDLSDMNDEDREGLPADFFPFCLANPEIVSFSEEMIEIEEGCLSVPEKNVTVTRPKIVKVRYIGYDGECRELEFSGWPARVFEHEMDHLNGKLITDYDVVGDESNLLVEAV